MDNKGMKRSLLIMVAILVLSLAALFAFMFIYKDALMSLACAMIIVIALPAAMQSFALYKISEGLNVAIGTMEDLKGEVSKLQKRECKIPAKKEEGMLTEGESFDSKKSVQA